MFQWNTRIAACLMTFLLRWRQPQPRNRRNKEGNREERRPRAPPCRSRASRGPSCGACSSRGARSARISAPCRTGGSLHRVLRHIAAPRAASQAASARCAAHRCTTPRASRRTASARAPRRPAAAARPCSGPTPSAATRHGPPTPREPSGSYAAAGQQPQCRRHQRRDLPNRANEKSGASSPGPAALSLRRTHSGRNTAPRQPRSATRSDSAETRRATPLPPAAPRARAASDHVACCPQHAALTRSLANFAAAPRSRRALARPVDVPRPVLQPAMAAPFYASDRDRLGRPAVLALRLFRLHRFTRYYPYAYDTFWPYAYDDVYEGMFGAYALRLSRHIRRGRTCEQLWRRLHSRGPCRCYLSRLRGRPKRRSRPVQRADHRPDRLADRAHCANGRAERCPARRARRA